MTPARLRLARIAVELEQRAKEPNDRVLGDTFEAVYINVAPSEEEAWLIIAADIREVLAS